MSKKVVFGDEAKLRLLAGVNIVGDAVGATMGVGGRNFLFRDEYGVTRSTKDGVTVAKIIDDLEDPIENMGAELIKNAAIRTASIAGDGTTTATVLTQYLANQGIKAVQNGFNAVEVKRGMESAKDLAISILSTMKQDIREETDDLLKVATLSANGDDEIGRIIAEAVTYVGLDGIVSVEESRYGISSRLEKVDGMQFESGLSSTSPYFVTDNKKNQALLESDQLNKDPLIFICEKEFNDVDPKQTLVPVLEYASTEQRAILIIAKSFGDQVLSTMLVNKGKGTVQCVAVKAPYYKEWQEKFLQDLAVLTGATLFNRDIHDLEIDSVESFVGSAKKIVVKKDSTIIIDAKGDPDAIMERIMQIKHQIDVADSDFTREKEQIRMGQIAGKVAIFHVGGRNEVERLESKDRAEDALYATYSALEEGILSGGGTALRRVSEHELFTDNFDSENYTSRNEGFHIVKRALAVPFSKILRNAGILDDEVDRYWALISDDAELVFDPEKKKILDALESGIIDPFKVTKTSLEHAVATAGIILLTESVLFKVGEQKVDVVQAMLDKM